MHSLIMHQINMLYTWPGIHILFVVYLFMYVISLVIVTSKIHQAMVR